MALWVFLLLSEPVHLPVLGALQRVHHVGHHSGQEEGHHVTPTPEVNYLGVKLLSYVLRSAKRGNELQDPNLTIYLDTFP